MEKQLNGRASLDCKAEEFADDTFDTLALDLLKHIETSQNQHTSCNDATNSVPNTTADKNAVSTVDIWTQERKQIANNDDKLVLDAVTRPTAHKSPAVALPTSQNVKISESKSMRVASISQTTEKSAAGVQSGGRMSNGAEISSNKKLHCRDNQPGAQSDGDDARYDEAVLSNIDLVSMVQQVERSQQRSAPQQEGGTAIFDSELLQLMDSIEQQQTNPLSSEDVVNSVELASMMDDIERTQRAGAERPAKVSGAVESSTPGVSDGALDVSFDDDFLAAACELTDHLDSASAIWELSGVAFVPLEVIAVQVDNRARVKCLTVRLANGRTAVSDAESKFVVALADEWFDTEAESGDLINVIRKDHPACTRVDDADLVVDALNHFVILNPHILISPSRVSQSFPCLRKGVLSGTTLSGTSNKVCVFGQLKHELFERFVKGEDFSVRAASMHIKSIVPPFVPELFAVGASDQETKKQLVKCIKPMISWCQTFLSGSGRARVPFPRYGELLLRKHVACEENLASFMWGLQGVVDMTLECDIFNAAGDVPKCTGVRTIPLELKTGRPNNTAHHAQVMLYSLMMSERYAHAAQITNAVSAGGLLLYISRQGGCKGSATVSRMQHTISGIPMVPEHVKHLLVQRNRIAAFLSRSSVLDCTQVSSASSGIGLPPMFEQESECARCNQFENCVLRHKVFESGTKDTSKLGALWDSTFTSLSTRHLEYFEKWMKAIQHEGAGSLSTQRELYILTAAQRQQKGHCVPNLKLVSTSRNSKAKYLYTFGYADGLPVDRCANGLTSGDYVIVSVDKKIVSVDKKDGDGTSREVPASVKTIFAVGKGKIVNSSPVSLVIASHQEISSAILENYSECRWRVDKAEYHSSIKLIKDNVTQLFLTPGSVAEAGFAAKSEAALSIAPSSMVARLRALVVDGAKPRSLRGVYPWDPAFKQAPHAAQFPSCAPQALRRDVHVLNRRQKAAVMRALLAQDYLLVQGMPGTGKTTMICFLIRCLVCLGKSVLVTSYTHTAVDNVLMKVKDHVPVLRLGNLDIVHPKMRSSALNFDSKLNTVVSVTKIRSKLTCMSTCMCSAIYAGSHLLGHSLTGRLQPQGSRGSDRRDDLPVDQASHLCPAHLRHVHR